MNAESLKHFVVEAALRSGVGRFVGQSSWRSARLAILCYHGVSIADEHEALPELYVSPAHLRARLSLLRRDGYSVLSLGDALDRLFSGRLPSRAVALTFDDGTRDFAEIVVPILDEFAMPATVYVTTYYCIHRWPVFDTAIRYLLWRGRFGSINLSLILGDRGRASCSLKSTLERAAALSAISESVKRRRLTAASKHDLLRCVAERVDVDFDVFLKLGQFSIMTPEQISSLPTPLVDVQLHSHRHRTPRNRALFDREITDNRNALEAMTRGRSTTHFCYPSGDYSAAFLHWLRELGVRSATTCVPQLASSRCDPLLLPRFVDTSLTSNSSFAAWIAGIADFLPRRRIHRLDAQRS